ncbi:MAG: TIR domain-containing protein [Bacteroidales bacterium]|nr:TIR domain-containing protein [Bacteroidales bacterium]
MDTLFNIIEQALRAHLPFVEVDTSATDDDVYMAIRQVMRDNPDIFWFSHQWSHLQSEAIVRFRYTIDNERSEKIRKQIEDVVQNDFKLDYVRTLSVWKQVIYVYKWIALYCNYDIHSAHNQTIFSVFVLRHSVCTGIAKAAQYLFELLGIESRLVFGKLKNSDEDSRHCWLIVKIEEKWYHLDPTFALPESEHLLHQFGERPMRGEDFLFYNFFCVDTASIKHSRTIEKEDLLPICNDKIEYADLLNINITPSRNGEQSGLGCILSDVGTTAVIYLSHNANKHYRHRSVAKVFKDDSDHELLRKELIVMRECAGLHLLRATDADFDKGILYMEQATPLSELLASHYYKLTLKHFCNLLIDIASGLKELLDHGILYRDIHLNNIYLSEDSIMGNPIYKLGDFGSCTSVDKAGKSADLTERGGVGSKWYMAPETWNKGIFDERSAVYGVGMIAYYLLNDLYPPFWQDYGEQSLDLRMQFHRLPVPTTLWKEKCRHLRMDFLFKSMRINAEGRYQTLAELIDAIKECANCNYPNLVLINGTEFKNVAKNAQNETFCSTCVGNPSIIVSNGEIEETAVDSDVECWLEDMLSDDNDDGQIAYFDSESQINDFATTCCGVVSAPSSSNENSYILEINSMIFYGICPPHFSIWHRLFRKRNIPQFVYSSVFAPAEIAPKQHLMVQVYLHLPEETVTVKSLASEADKNAERKGYEPLEVPLKKGDNVEIELNVNGDNLLYNCRKSVVWQGSFVKRAFDFVVPADINVHELSSSVNIFVNGAIAGELLFLTAIADSPRQLNTNVCARPTKKLFISYSHKDIVSAEKIAKIHEALGIDVFFDKHRLKAGYIYSEEISKFIQNADTFVLCWSENAAKSDYVEKERQEALALAYPQSKPRDQARLRIHPYNIEPHAVPPADMIEHYHFEEL